MKNSRKKEDRFDKDAQILKNKYACEDFKEDDQPGT